MRRNFLGKTGIEVTELCFGALPMGPLQAKLPVEEGTNLLLNALNQGINFVDTAEMYQTYDQIRGALAQYKGEVVLATKSTAETYAGMEKAIIKALNELRRDYIGVFHLHAASVTAEVFTQRRGALECLIDYKKKGYIRAIGISTHSIKAVEAAANVEEIDVVFPIINMLGMGIIDGGPNEMIQAINKVHDAGKGIYGMKALAGGNLIYRLEEAFNYVRAIPGMASVAVGMVSHKEIDLNESIS